MVGERKSSRLSSAKFKRPATQKQRQRPRIRAFKGKRLSEPVLKATYPVITPIQLERFRSQLGNGGSRKFTTDATAYELSGDWLVGEQEENPFLKKFIYPNNATIYPMRTITISRIRLFQSGKDYFHYAFEVTIQVNEDPKQPRFWQKRARETERKLLKILKRVLEGQGYQVLSTPSNTLQINYIGESFRTASERDQKFTEVLKAIMDVVDQLPKFQNKIRAAIESNLEGQVILDEIVDDLAKNKS